MNERIRELWTSVCQNEMPELDETCMTLSRQRKFAKLIVQELVCVGNQAWLNDNSVAPTFPEEQIKEHFGVE